MTNHKKRAHALLSASSSKRWLACTPSAVLEDSFPNQDSIFSVEGTRAHELSELILSSYTSNEVKEWEEDANDLRIIAELDGYIQYIQEQFHSLKERFEHCLVFLESRLDYSRYVPDGFGTGDVIMLAGDELHVIDLKFGKGILVSAINNSQLRLYALGAMEKFKDFYNVKHVFTHIAQPRLNNYSVEELSVEVLEEWANSYVVPRALLAFNGEGEFVAGEHCKFCKAAATCRHLMEENMKIAFSEVKDPSLISSEEVSNILEHADQITDWIKAVKDFATGELIQGAEVPGWKVVEGRANRTYLDEIRVAEKLKSSGVEEALIYERKLLGITAMEKVVGKKKFGELLDGLIIKPQGKPTLVKEEDSRPALTNAELLFKDVEGGE